MADGSGEVHRQRLPRRAVGAGIAALAAALLVGCQVPRPMPPAIPPRPDDLLYQARGWREREGLVAARGHLAEALAALDASHGELERRVARTNREPAFTFPDSLAALPRSRRERTGIYLVLGFRQNTGEAARVLNHLAATMRDDGWHAQVVPLNEWGSPRDHARSIERFLRRDLPQVDRAVMVGFSMGASSWVCWMIDHSAGWTAAERKKLRLGVFFAGSLRGAALARWAVTAKGFHANVMRSKLNELDGGTGKARRAIWSAAQDLWDDRRLPPLDQLLPGLRLVDYVTLPDGARGLPERDPLMKQLAAPVARQMPWIGPFDGMVEGAAQVLPPGDPTPQHIVRVFGSHGITEGFYFKGGEVSPRHGRIPSARPQAAEDMVRDLLRALPADLLK